MKKADPRIFSDPRKRSHPRTARSRSHARVARAGSGYIITRVRLTADEIQYLARKILKTLIAEGKLQVDSEPRQVEALTHVLTDELMVEDRLNQEVRDVLLQHASEIERTNIGYTEMFKMLKKKLAREKGIVL